ncbi:MAG TPA: hypothetical protein VFD01_17065 [Candidatus Dormibacteraeota bacterium]|nr:hypothetical protein [Candidatus Dormibacteraeota bacterium]
MSAGTLSPAQQSYVDVLAGATGLDPDVVTAWVGSESGWGITKPSNNYLNIGPGYNYPDPAQGAEAAARLLNTSGYYSSIRAAVPQGAAAQVAAITASPWDAGHYGAGPGNPGNLAATYASVTGKGGILNDVLGFLKNIGGSGLAGPIGMAAADAPTVAGAAGAVVNAAKSTFDFFSGGWEKVALRLLFVAASLGLVLLGLTRLFPGVTRSIVQTVSAAGRAAAA